MAAKSKPRAALHPNAWDELKRLPGNVRRQLTKAIDSLENDPRPPESQQLKLNDDPREVRRLRVAGWRVIYVVSENQLLILAIRRRPPYDYEDLGDLLADIE
jgi:mRNA interferase RelE/StbE